MLLCCQLTQQQQYPFAMSAHHTTGGLCVRTAGVTSGNASTAYACCFATYLLVCCAGYQLLPKVCLVCHLILETKFKVGTLSDQAALVIAVLLLLLAEPVALHKCTIANWQQ